jgi:hypothetical protein
VGNTNSKSSVSNYPRKADQFCLGGTMSDKTKREIYAYHEAGHAAFAFVCHFRIKSASIRPQGREGGRVILKSRILTTPTDILGNLGCLVAGAMAVSRITGSDDMHGAQGDLDQLVRAVVEANLSHESALQLYDELTKEVTRVLEQPPIWTAVEAVAASLLDREYLSGRVVERIIQDSITEAEQAMSKGGEKL